jgi:hypothetical protein
MATSSGNKGKAKFLFIGGGVVAAVALVVFFQNYPPKPADATGTIGAADRYHATQITSADVNVTPDEITTWLQSDTFDKIVKDPQARALFTNEMTLKIMGDSNRRLVALGDAAQQSIQMAADAQTKMVAIAGDAAKVQVASDAAKVQVASDAAKVQVAGDAAKVQIAPLDSNAVRLADEAKKMVVLESQANVAADLADQAQQLIQVYNDARIRMVAGENAKVQIAAADARMVRFLDEAKKQMVAFEDQATQMAKFSLDARGKYLAAEAASVRMVAGEARGQKMAAADQALRMADESRNSIQAFADESRKSVQAYDAALKAAEGADGIRKVQTLSDGVSAMFANEAIKKAICNEAFCRAVANGAVQSAMVAQVRNVTALESGARPE